MAVPKRAQVGHQDFVWELRKDPRIVEVFEAMLGTNELLTSFDGCAYTYHHSHSFSCAVSLLLVLVLSLQALD